ncbi:MAG: hypothetical protein LBJ04_12415 [Sphingobacterium sp.]|jgi:hypothetical protein|uniref:hypothetical protein n=1 Tax=Sphingobacterium sp. TaxID=341027 RepID=UPI00282E6F43|nr:hypothetical protein [Sphingobacterium sp.]MDR0264018.1 hypothetical protein [Sphingobacterium sp.]
MKHLIQFSLLLTVYLLFFSSSLLAQNPERTKTIPIPSDSAYSKIIQALQGGGYFIAQLDRPSGFIQTSMYLKNNKFLSNKEGEKLISNFLISPLKDGGSKIILNIFLIERRKGGSFDSPNYYDEDKGILRENSAYQQIWDRIIPILQ